MNTKRIWQVVAAVAGVILVIGLGFTVFLGRVSAPTPPPPQAPQTQTVSVTIDGVYANKQVSISSNETVLQVLQMLNAQDSTLQLETKEYAGMGTLVMGIHGVTNGTDKKYWQYKVNGVMPQIGAGALQLKNGDSVAWFFSASQE